MRLFGFKSTIQVPIVRAQAKPEPVVVLVEPAEPPPRNFDVEGMNYFGRRWDAGACPIFYIPERCEVVAVIFATDLSKWFYLLRDKSAASDWNCITLFPYQDSQFATLEGGIDSFSFYPSNNLLEPHCSKDFI